MLSGKQEGTHMSGNWVKCTFATTAGNPIYVNLANVLTIGRQTYRDEESTRISFTIGAEPKDGISVREMPEELLTMERL
jgi:hypothetical protein